MKHGTGGRAGARKKAQGKRQFETRRDPRWSLVDSILRHLLRLTSYWGIAPEILCARLKATVELAILSNLSTQTLSIQPARTYEELFGSPEILRLWCQDPDFVDASGQPRRLPVSGPAPSFVQLVKRAARGLDAQTALRELVAAQAIEQFDDGTVMVTNRLVIYEGPSRQAEIGLYAVDNLLASMERNISSPSAKDSLQCEAVCLNFDKRQLPRISRFLRRQSLAALEQTDDWLHQHTVQADDPAREAVTVAVGLYITVRKLE